MCGSTKNFFLSGAALKMHDYDFLIMCITRCQVFQLSNNDIFGNSVVLRKRWTRTASTTGQALAPPPAWGGVQLCPQPAKAKWSFTQKNALRKVFGYHFLCPQGGIFQTLVIIQYATLRPCSENLTKNWTKFTLWGLLHVTSWWCCCLNIGT